MNKPLVTICIPVYNVEKYIEKCCRSLFEQTYKSIEYVFVDDCTPCSSVQIILRIIEEYPDRKGSIKIVKHEFNKGLAAARNTGIANATGEFIMHMDSDDYLDIDLVEKLINTAIDEKADIVCCDTKYIYPKRRFIASQTISCDPKEYAWQLLTYKVGVNIWGKLFRKTLFTENGIKSIEGLNFGEDYVTTPRIAYNAKRIAHCKGVYYNYVQFNTNSYTNLYKNKNIDDLVLAVRILDEFFTSKNENYSLHIDKAKLINKQKLIIAICLHYEQVGFRLKEVCGLFSEVDRTTYTTLGTSSRLILWLADKKYIIPLRVFVIIGFRIKQILKRLF